MELPFKPQSTSYTCVQAVQAIAMNYSLGTKYTDLDVIARSERGYPLNFISNIRETQIFVSKRLGFPLQENGIHLQTANAVYEYLLKHKTLPPFKDAVEYLRDYHTQIQKSNKRNLGTAEESGVGGDIDLFEGRIRDNDRLMENLERLLHDRKEKEFYDVFTGELHDGLLQPIGYHFSRDPYDDGIPPLIEVSEGRLSVEPFDIGSLDDVIARDNVVIFGADRDVFGLPSFFGRSGHQWIIDRTEGDQVVLLDTNHSAYGHGPEIFVPKTVLTVPPLKNVLRVSQKE